MIELMQLAIEMSKDIQYLKAYIEALKNTKGKKLSEDWLDNQEVLLTLHISPRTLQSYRDNGTLPFSKIEGKFYYKASDIENLLQSNYTNKSKDK